MDTRAARVLARSVDQRDRINAVNVLYRDLDESIDVLRGVAAAGDEASVHARLAIDKARLKLDR